uniref:Uncharacterized protein LOC107070460 n=1 Tax=Polistes dominula TaxID=743375 RepID=A0ABM1IVE4_POLDO
MAQPTSEAEVTRADTKEVNASEFRNVTLPAFWKEEPNLWFVMLEKEFTAYNVKSDAVKFSAVLRNLDTTLIREVHDILASPPEQCTYTHLKEALIHRLTKSDEQRLRRLLMGIELGDKKPSELWREMKRLAGDSVSEKMLLTLWMQRMPTRIQEILAIADEITSPAKLAEMGDKILGRERLPETAAITEAAPIRSTAQTTINSEVAEIKREIAQLTKKIKNLMRGRRKYRSSRGRSRSRSRSSSKHRNNDGLCYYHWKFAEQSW